MKQYIDNRLRNRSSILLFTLAFGFAPPLLATSTAAAYTCLGDPTGWSNGAIIYHDNTLYEDFEENIEDAFPGHSTSDFHSELFFVVNLHPWEKSLKDIQLLLFCDDDLIARTVRGPNIAYQDAAKFNIPFPLVGGSNAPCSTARLQTEVRWVSGGGYKRIGDSYDLSLTDGSRNGIWVGKNYIDEFKWETYGQCE